MLFILYATLDLKVRYLELFHLEVSNLKTLGQDVKAFCKKIISLKSYGKNKP